VPAVLDDGDVQVHHVAVLELFLARHAVADLMIDRGADGLGIGGVAGRGVVQRRRNAALRVHLVVVAEPVQFAGGDAGFHEGVM
jgi:hypothetical protein